MQINNIQELEIYFRNAKMFDLLGIDKIGVFGSFARNETFNDIDLMIEDDVETNALISFSDKLKKEIQNPFDILLSKYTEPIILHRAKQDVKYATRK